MVTGTRLGGHFLLVDHSEKKQWARRSQDRDAGELCRFRGLCVDGWCMSMCLGRSILDIYGMVWDADTFLTRVASPLPW